MLSLCRSDSLFPHREGRPGYEVPRSKNQFDDEGSEQAGPGKVSRNIGLRSDFTRSGSDGSDRD